MNTINNLKLALSLIKMTQTELAEKADVSRWKLNMALNHPSSVVLNETERQKISKVLKQFDPWWLFSEFKLEGGR